MSTILDAAACSDAQRREDLARNDAAMEAEFIAASIARNVNKGPRLAALSVECARQLELNGYIGELPR